MNIFLFLSYLHNSFFYYFCIFLIANATFRYEYKVSKRLPVWCVKSIYYYSGFTYFVFVVNVIQMLWILGALQRKIRHRQQRPTRKIQKKKSNITRIKQNALGKKY